MDTSAGSLTPEELESLQTANDLRGDQDDS